jgi:hypothetical protein
VRQADAKRERLERAATAAADKNCTAAASADDSEHEAVPTATSGTAAKAVAKAAAETIRRSVVSIEDGMADTLPMTAPVLADLLRDARNKIASYDMTILRLAALAQRWGRQAGVSEEWIKAEIENAKQELQHQHQRSGNA